MTVEFEAAIHEFLEFAHELQSQSVINASAVMQHVADSYRQVRIEDALVDLDHDMLLLQWGAESPLVADRPLDLRRVSDGDIEFEESQLQYVDFTRQIHPAGDDEDAEFDDLAVQLSITLFYGPAIGDEKSSNMWIRSPQELEEALESFRDVPFIHSLLDEKASRVVATAGYCG